MDEPILVNATAQLHERFRELLDSANAESCSIVATFLDIRGFSAFSAPGGPFDSALYLRSVYEKILAEHFNDTIFFKPTGDGLLLIHELPSVPEDVPQAISSILVRAVNLVDVFGQIVSDDIMINFDKPQNLGVGIARGSATRLVSGGVVLDYTGRCLNLAARLMDKARPSGVVFADSHARRLMTDDVMPLFVEDDIFIRGISEDVPMSINVSGGVEIQAADRQPFSEGNRWGYSTSLTVEEVRDSSSYGFYLRRPPRDDERVGVYIRFPVFDKNGRPKEAVSTYAIDGQYEEGSSL
jgi:class 3 adenylate cyclase